jgi:uncharacterized protein
MFLVDTNVWLERLLDQDRAAEVGDFLDRFPSERLFMTDFALHSIGVVLSRLNQLDTLSRFVQDTFVDGAVVLIHLQPEDTEYILQAIQEFNLDFDDAYQYVSAKKYNLTLVSFDSDFDHTATGKKTPAEAMQHR